MSAQQDDDAVGYRRPPKAFRWKKGQCGNPGRKRTRALKGAAEIIDQLFAKPVNVVESGSARRANGLEVIVTQLVKKENWRATDAPWRSDSNTRRSLSGKTCHATS
jgi:Family of unknown function (DUF5681)